MELNRIFRNYILQVPGVCQTYRFLRNAIVIIKPAPELKFIDLLRVPAARFHSAPQTVAAHRAAYDCVVAIIIVLSLGTGGCNQTGPPTLGVLAGVYNQPVSGHTVFGADWLEIVPPSPLRVVEIEQSIRLQVGGIADMTLSDSLILDDGRTISITAEVIDDQGTRYPLTLGGISGGKHAYFYRAGDYPPGPDFQVNRKIVRLRVRSDAPLEVEEIRWICTTPH